MLKTTTEARMTKRTYEATSPNGVVVTRTTERTYTHAIFLRHGPSFVAAGTMLPGLHRGFRTMKFPVQTDRQIGAADWWCEGFSGSEVQAHRTGAAKCGRVRGRWPEIEIEYRVVPCTARPSKDQAEQHLATHQPKGEV